MTKTGSVWLLFCLLWLPQLSAQALEGYGEIGLGVTLMDISQPEAEYEEDRDVSIAVQSMAAGGGIRWLPFLSTGLQLWFWGDRQVDSSSDKRDAAGTGVSADVTLRLPIAGGGPYVRYGRMCWAMRISGLESRWSEGSCSPLTTAGIAFGLPLTDGGEGQIRLEYSRMELTDDVTSYNLMATVHAAF